jgi:hypothetical protein
MYNLELTKDELNVLFWSLNDYCKNNVGFSSALDAGAVIDKLNKLI